MAGMEEKREEKKTVKVSGLNAYYRESGSIFSGASRRRQILRDISFFIEKGKILGLVGESGSGKSTLGKALLGMVKDVEGKIEHFTKNPQMVFQDPYGSLNPVKRIGWLLEEPLRIKGVAPKTCREAADRMLLRVGLSGELRDRYPSELSGGQRQRVCIAMALMLSPGLIIADEPVSALDVTVQEKIIRLLLDIQREMGFSMLLISHDLGVVYRMCSRVMVLKDGVIVERGDTREIYAHPNHGYTKALLRAAEIYRA